MLNWDMKNINDIEYLFDGCSKLKNIKMNFYNNNPKCFEEKKIWKKYYPGKTVFNGLPESGSFVSKKGTNCNELLKYLPVSWNRTQE